MLCEFYGGGGGGWRFQTHVLLFIYNRSRFERCIDLLIPIKVFRKIGWVSIPSNLIKVHQSF